MPHSLYRIFCTSVLGLPSDSWAITRSEAAFKNLILHDLDAMMYYFDTDIYYKNEPISLPGDLKDMATIFARLTLVGILPDGYVPTNPLPQIPTKQSVPTSKDSLLGYYGIPIAIPMLRSLIGPAIDKVRIPWLSFH
jgi:hypothetical protein